MLDHSTEVKPMATETKINEGTWTTVLSALSEKPRLRIMRTLLGGPMCVSDISEAIDAKIYNTSRHLKTLREANLVCSTRDGAKILFEICPEIRARIDDDGKTLNLGCCSFDFSQLECDCDQAQT